MKKKIKQIIALNKERTKGKWSFCFSYHLGQYSSLQNDKDEIILQASGVNDGDYGLHWLDEDMKKSDMILIEKIPEMINIILKLKKENKKLMSLIKLNDALKKETGAFKND